MNGTEGLSEYLDGELAPDEAEALEARLEREPELRALLEELRTVKHAAAARADLEAPPELWSSVRERIATEDARPHHDRLPFHRRLMFTLPQLAAAAGIVLLLGVTLGRMTGPTAAPDGAPSVDPNPALVSDGLRAPSLTLFVEDLEARLEAGRDVLEPGTALVIEASLAKIDTAIVQARTALENDPNNVYLNQHLASARSRKLRLLEDATALIASKT